MTSLEAGLALFLLVSLVMFSVVGFGLMSGKTLGIAFRSRFIARRHEEPALYWMSLTMFAAFGLVALCVVVSNLRLIAASL